MGILVQLLLPLALVPMQSGPAIDRKALVSRHDPVLTAFDGNRPLQVGNGEFAFGMDITGLQTFAPFNTMSQWGWHTSALPPGQIRALRSLGVLESPASVSFPEPLSG